jgi:MFS family permease
MLCLVFGLSLLDRTNISAAYIAGLAEDLRLDIGARYSIALLVFFPGYCIFELPSNMVIRRLGARWWLSFLIVAWGCMVLGMGFIHDWRILTVLRAFLGCFEAGLFPGGVFIIASWYRQFETARRVSLFYMASLICSGFGPIFAYALSLISVGDGMYAAGWRWICKPPDQCPWSRADNVGSHHRRCCHDCRRLHSTHLLDRVPGKGAIPGRKTKAHCHQPLAPREARQRSCASDG